MSTFFNKFAKSTLTLASGVLGFGWHARFVDHRADAQTSLQHNFFRLLRSRNMKTYRLMVTIVTALLVGLISLVYA